MMNEETFLVRVQSGPDFDREHVRAEVQEFTDALVEFLTRVKPAVRCEVVPRSKFQVSSSEGQ
jgi:hypothetical protein